MSKRCTDGRMPAPTDPAAESALHPATAALVAAFSAAMAEKLRAAEIKYGYSDGWARDDWGDECLAHLWEHLAKGDPLDVAIYAAFMWHHGWPTKARTRRRPASPAREAMEKALRSLAIKSVGRLTYGGGIAHAGWTCKLCEGDWDVGAAENHTADCLATPPKPRKRKAQP